ncbi:MAG: helix-turn-helix domain-containing protein [Oscillospiraceae bacterium]|nr:helix-turn-helix domain-containing protein [Oscillospiraceae bacterium]
MFENYADIITINDLMTMLNIGKSTAYSLLQNNKIHHVKIGRKYVIPKQSVVDFVAGLCYNEDRIISGRLQSARERSNK